MFNRLKFLFLLSFSLLSFSLFGSEYSDYQSSLTLSESSPVLSKSSRVTSTASTLGSASITWSKYPTFSWLIFQNWSWESSDEYSTFYTFDQRYKDYSIYRANLSLFIYRTSGTSYENAQIGITVANTNNADIVHNKQSTTFGISKIPSYRNSYSYVSTGGTSYSVDTWYFTKYGTTYLYRIFTTVGDWNTNKDIYILLTQGLFFKVNTLSKVSGVVSSSPYLSYHSSSDGVSFSGVPNGSRVMIYDVTGKLIRDIGEDSSWDGLDTRGVMVSGGFYLSNIVMPQGTATLKFLNR